MSGLEGIPLISEPTEGVERNLTESTYLKDGFE